jgi:hypothetical protein
VTTAFLPFFRRRFQIATLKALRHCAKYPVKVGLQATSMFGVALLAMVFWDIGEMPQVDGASIGPLLTTIAFGGFAVAAALAMFAVAGGAVARFSFTVPAEIDDRWVLATYLLPASMVAASLSIFALAYPAWEKYPRSLPGWLAAVGPVMAAGIVFHRRKEFSGWKQTGVAWLALGWNSAALTVIGSLLLVNMLPATTYERSSIRLLGAAFALWAIYFAVLVAFARRIETPHQVSAFMVWAFVAAMAVMSASGAWMSVAHAMVKRIGWGNVPAKLFLTNRGCEILNRSVGHDICHLQPGASAQYVCPAWVRSRIGTPVFLSVSPFSPSGAWPDHDSLRHVSLPREDVLVVQRISSKQRLPDEGLAHDGIATYLDLPAGKKGRWLVEQCGVDLPSALMPPAPSPQTVIP